MFNLDHSRQTINIALNRQPIVDLHTHLYSPAFGTPVLNVTGKIDPTGLMLWGIDELVTYHYLVAEVFRVVPADKLPYEQFWKMNKSQQADHIWKNLFVERTPISEACRGVITTLTQLGLDPNVNHLDKLRPFFAQQDPSKYIDKVMELSHVSSITMTNNVFDDNERNRWLAGGNLNCDSRFTAVLRIDQLLTDWPGTVEKLNQWGFSVESQPTEKTIAEVQRFLRQWIDRIKAIYIALSLPGSFRYPADANNPSARSGQVILEKAILPVCAERGLPFAMMIGVTRGANPALKDAADMVGPSDVPSVVNLCREFPKNKFMVTMLARENQHEMAVAARKFGNLMIFGCWWYLNNPSLIEEITRMRLELLGTSMIPQHSDCRILEQLIYKWEHSRKIIGKVLTDKYLDLAAAGWKLSEEQIQRDVRLLLKDNFAEFLAR